MSSSLLNFGMFVCFATLISKISHFLSKANGFGLPYLSQVVHYQLQLPYICYLELSLTTLQNYSLSSEAPKNETTTTTAAKATATTTTTTTTTSTSTTTTTTATYYNKNNNNNDNIIIIFIQY